MSASLTRISTMLGRRCLMVRAKNISCFGVLTKAGLYLGLENGEERTLVGKTGLENGKYLAS